MVITNAMFICFINIYRRSFHGKFIANYILHVDIKPCAPYVSIYRIYTSISISPKYFTKFIYITAMIFNFGKYYFEFDGQNRCTNNIAMLVILLQNFMRNSSKIKCDGCGNQNCFSINYYSNDKQSQ